MFLALVALCAAFQGEVRAVSPTLESSETLILKSGISEIELEFVLNEVVEHTGLTYSEARSLYQSGKMTIEKVNGGYFVSFSVAEDGGLADILIATGL